MTSASETSPITSNHGYFLDGLSPHKQPFSLAIFNDGLSYSLQNGEIKTWKFNSINWGQSSLNHRPLFLKHLMNEDTCLVVTDNEVISRILIAQKIWGKKNFWLIHAEQKSVILFFLIIALMLMCLWLTWPPIADQIAMAAPRQLRDAIGHLGDEYLKDEKICTSPEAGQALKMIQIRLSRGQPDLLKLKLNISDRNSINAYTLPGNEIILTRGLLERAEGEDEVAGVVAHEFGHVLKNHVMRGFLRNILPKVFVSVFSQALGSFSQIADMFVGNAYSRKFEIEADATALDILKQAKVSPKGLEKFFKKLQEDKKSFSRGLAYLSDHPAPAERILMVRNAEISTPLTEGKILDSKQWLALKKACNTKSTGLSNIEN
jgi:Zn-dependent protease with chaperone function